MWPSSGRNLSGAVAATAFLKIISTTLPCATCSPESVPNCEPAQLAEMRFRLKDGNLQPVDGDDPVSIGFDE